MATGALDLVLQDRWPDFQSVYTWLKVCFLLLFLLWAMRVDGKRAGHANNPLQRR
jgi:hypothetical protein